jgi:F0F1-type ATP synthase assembly protein I
MERHNEDLPSGKESEHSVFQQLAPFLTIGFQLAATVTIFFFAGQWLDNQFNSAPWCMIGLTAGGIGAGLYKFIRTVMTLGKEEDERWKKGKHDRKES